MRMLPAGAANAIFSAMGNAQPRPVGGIGTPYFQPRQARRASGGTRIQPSGPGWPGGGFWGVQGGPGQGMIDQRQAIQAQLQGLLAKPLAREVNYGGAYRAPIDPYMESSVEANPAVRRLFDAFASREFDRPAYGPLDYDGMPWGMPMYPAQATGLIDLMGIRAGAHGLGRGTY